MSYNYTLIDDMKFNGRLCRHHQRKRSNHNSDNLSENILQTEMSYPVERESDVFLVFLVRNSESSAWPLISCLSLKSVLSESSWDAEGLMALPKWRGVLVPLHMKSAWLLEALVGRILDFLVCGMKEQFLLI